MTEPNKQPLSDLEALAPGDFGAALTRLEFPEHRRLQFHGKVAPDGATLGRWLIERQALCHSTDELFKLYEGDFGGLTRAGVNRLFFAHKVVQGWLDQLAVDAELKPLVAKWSPGMEAALAAHPDMARDSGHPLRELLNLVEQHSFGWFSGLERNGRPWIDHLAAIATFFESPRAVDAQAQTDQLKVTRQFVEKDVSRVKVLEKRVREAEIGADRAWYCRQLVHSTINTLFTGSLLPEAVAQFVAGPWRDSMQLILLEEGAQGSTWLRHSKLIETLAWSMQDSDDAQAKQRLYQVAARLVDEIAKGLRVFKHHPQEAEPWLERLQELLMVRIKGQSVSRVQADLLPVEPGFQQKDDLVTDQGYGLLNKWFLHRETGTRQKCVAYIGYQEGVVWANYLGRKLGTQPWNAVKEELRMQVLQPLAAQSSFDQILESTVARFLSIDSLQQKQRQFAQNREAARERLEDAAREQARQKAEEEAARIQREREAMAKRLEQERAEADERSRQEQLQAEESARLAGLQAARDAVDRLKLGGWLELIDGDERKRCKLAVRLNATDKLVFVDRLGLRIGDFKREDIVNRVLEGTAKILDEGADFDQRLSRVVGSIRSDKR